MRFKSLLLIIYLLSASSADEVSTGSDSLGKTLYRHLPTDGRNVVFSPFSLHSVLALTYEASAGETENRLRTNLGLPTKEDTALQYRSTMSNFNIKTNVTFKIANKVYVRNDRNLKSQFKKVAKNYFLTETESLDFTRPPQAAREINDWIREKTADKIPEIVSSSYFDENTRVVLLNAIYFKGKWATKFDIDETKPTPFYVNEQETVNCRMMHQLGEYYYSENVDLDATLLKLSFRNERFGLMIILPNSKTGINHLERQLERINITALSNQLWGRQVEVYLPRFKIESNFHLETPLKNIGLSQIFSNDAQFPDMIDGGENLTISKVIQKATIEINEEGGEASTATIGLIAVPISANYEPPPLVTFKADHPFLFLLTAGLGEDNFGYYKDEVVVFMGKVVYPEIVY